MNLTPEEKKLGQENFRTVIGTTRRDFLKKSALAAVVSGSSLGAAYFGYSKTFGRSDSRWSDWNWR